MKNGAFGVKFTDDGLRPGKASKQLTKMEELANRVLEPGFAVPQRLAELASVRGST